MKRDLLIRLLITFVLLAGLIPAARLTAHAAPLPDAAAPDATLWRWLGGGDISDVFFLGDGRHGWAATTQGFLLRTEDGGEAWQYVPDVPVNKLYFVSAGRGYGIGSGSIWLTMDGGLTWVVQQAGTGNLADIEFISQTEGWAAGGDEVYHTADGGASWTPQVPITGSIVAISFVDAQYGWAVGANIVQRTVDGGATWFVAEALPVFVDEGHVLSDVHFVNRTDGWAAGSYKGGESYPWMYETRDGGESWPTQAGPYSIASTHGRGGECWSVFFRGPEGWVRCSLSIFGTGLQMSHSELVIHLVNGLETQTTIDLSTDIKRLSLVEWHGGYHGAGADWFPTFTSLALANNATGILIGPDDDPILLLPWHYSPTLFKSENAGLSFQRLRFRADDAFPGDGPTTRMRFLDENRIWLAIGTYRYYTGGVFHSANGGATWVTQIVPGEQLCPGTEDCLGWIPVGIEMINATTGWVAGYKTVLVGQETVVTNQVLATTDGGASWTEQYSSQEQAFSDLSFADTEHGWAVGGDTLFHTADGGQTWITQTANAPITAIQFVSPTLGWGVGISGTIQHTRDGGQTWRFQSSGTTATLHDLDFVDADNGWAVGNGGTILRTRDGGQTWAIEASGTTARLTAIDMADAYNGWVIGDGGLILGRHLIPPPQATATPTATNTPTPTETPTITPTSTPPTLRHYLPLALK